MKDLTILYQRVDYQTFEALKKGLCEEDELQALITKTIEKNKQMQFLIFGSDEQCGWNKVQQSVLQQVKSRNFELNYINRLEGIDIKLALMQPNRKLNGRTLLMEILQYGIDSGTPIDNFICYVFGFMPFIEQEKFLLQPDFSGHNAFQLLNFMIYVEDKVYLKTLLPQLGFGKARYFEDLSSPSPSIFTGFRGLGLNQ